MNINKDMIKILELDRFQEDLKNIENQYLDLIYDPFFKNVCERSVYEKHIGCMEWKCAICGNNIIIDKRKNDPENFVCEFCRETYNNKNQNVDRRILESRNEMYMELIKRIYDEFEDSLFYKG
jgi:hypothetical protein